MGLEQFIVENCPEYLQDHDDAAEEIEEDVEDDDEIIVKKIKVTESMKLLIRFHTHKFDVNGKHVSFR
jgi:hypothetical protein